MIPRIIIAAVACVLLTVPAGAACTDWFITPPCGVAGLDLGTSKSVKKTDMMQESAEISDFSARKRNKRHFYATPPQSATNGPLFGWLFRPMIAPETLGRVAGRRPGASCGWHMRHELGGRYAADPEFNRAYAYARLPRTSLAPGALVVSARKGRGCGGPCGHVVRVISVIDQCNAIVSDNSGTYQRNTCRARVAVVQP